MTKPLSTEIEEGDTIVIECEVVGDPKPEVMWLRDFLKVRNFFYKLIFQNDKSINMSKALQLSDSKMLKICQ